MYFFRYEPLKEQLRTRSMSERASLPYLVVFGALYAAYFLFPTSPEYNLWDWISAGSGVVLAIAGVIYAYVKNGGNAGFDLIQKYVVLGWVVSIRCMLGFFSLGLVLFMIGRQQGLMGAETTWFGVLFGLGFQAILYQRIGRHIADTR